MADDYTISVTYPSPATVGVPIAVDLGYGGQDLGGFSWTVTFTDSGAGGSFNPPTAVMGDSSSGSPTSVQTLYTPAAAGVVQFAFSENQAFFSFDLQPPQLVVLPGFDPKKSSAFLGFF